MLESAVDSVYAHPAAPPGSVAVVEAAEFDQTCVVHEVDAFGYADMADFIYKYLNKVDLSVGDDRSMSLWLVSRLTVDDIEHDLRKRNVETVVLPGLTTYTTFSRIKRFYRYLKQEHPDLRHHPAKRRRHFYIVRAYKEREGPEIPCKPHLSTNSLLALSSLPVTDLEHAHIPLSRIWYTKHVQEGAAAHMLPVCSEDTSTEPEGDKEQPKVIAAATHQQRRIKGKYKRLPGNWKCLACAPSKLVTGDRKSRFIQHIARHHSDATHYRWGTDNAETLLCEDQ